MNIQTNCFCLLIEKWQVKILFIIKHSIIILMINHYKQKIIKVILNLLKAIMQNKLNKRNFNLKKMKFKAI